MRISLRRNGFYIPEWRGNRELPENEQLQVEFEYLTAADKEELFVSSNSASVGSLTRQVWNRKVKKFYNFELEVDGEIIQPTPESVLNLPDTFDLFTEVATHIFEASYLDKETQKN